MIDETALDMCEHAAVAMRPLVAPTQHASFVPFRTSALRVKQSLQASKAGLLRPRRHHHQTTAACQHEPQLESHACRRSVLALGVAGLCMTQQAQTASAETALPPELREWHTFLMCITIPSPLLYRYME